jgi:hypothetical protein
MPYVLRDANGLICCCSDKSYSNDWEEISAYSAEYLNFIKLAEENTRNLQNSDLGMARILEDLIDLLISNNTIKFTDLPTVAQNRIISRREMRKKINVLDIIEENEYESHPSNLTFYL